MLKDKYIKRQFSSYEDFKNNFNVEIPENFNFGFDVVDEIAAKEPGKKAMVWCDEKGDHREFTFEDIKIQQ